jgi:protein tyrosine kinase modulator
MLPGTKYSPEDILRVLFRRAWLVVIPVLLGVAGSVVVGHRLPNKYRSETLILVVPQRIPDSYVRATVTAKIEDRLPTISQQILSRSRLERIILDLDLYRAQRNGGIMEDVVQLMRGDIDVKVERGDSFRVTYVSSNAKTAQKVTERIASLFIEENLRDRENLAEDTNQFLDSQLQDAKRRLVEHEKRLEAYNKRYSGQLPSQAAANLQQIHNAQLQVQSLAEAMDRDRERRQLLERQLADQESSEPLLIAPTPTAPAVEGLPAESTVQQLEAARARLRVLETRAKPDHPDVRQLQRTIRDLQAKLESESKHPATAETRIVSPAEAVRQRRIRELNGEIDAVGRELQDKTEQDRRLRGLIAAYQAKVDAVPTREAELVELTRDYTTVQTSYQSLLAKREDSKIAANLERRNIGEQFKILDPARVPERPFTPDRRVLGAGGFVAGLAFGLLFIAVLEYRDSSFRHEDDVVRVLSMPVLAVVPLIWTKRELKERAQRRVVIGVTAVAAILSVAATVLWGMQR